MTVDSFAANLRSEMGRQGVGLQELLRRLSGSRGDSDNPVPLGFNRAYLLCTCNPTNLLSGPTPAEITALATALECSEERLTVSREQLEEREAACRHAWQLNQIEGAENEREIDALLAQVAELERRLDYAEAACADVSWECPRCLRVNEIESSLVERTARVAELASTLREIRNICSLPIYSTEQITDLIEEASV
jgi:hypothetical protein